jgi:hypothetical protein
MDSDRPEFLHRASDLIRRHLPQIRPEYDSDNPLAQDERTSSLDKRIPRCPPLAHIAQRQRHDNASVAHHAHDGRTSPFDKPIPHSPWQQYLRRPPIAHIIGPNRHGEERHFLSNERVGQSPERGSRTPEHEPNPPIGQIRNNTTGVIRDWKPEDGEPDPLQSGETRYRDFATEPANAYRCECHTCGQRNPPIGQIRNNTTGVVRKWKPKDGEPDPLQSGETRYRDFATEPSRVYCCQCATCTYKHRHNPSQTHRYAEGAQTMEH